LFNGKYYVLAQREDDKFGTTNTLTNAKAITYVGFTNEDIVQMNINFDGSTIVNVFYNRNTHIVSLSGDLGIVNVSGAGTYKYGQFVTINATVANGYNWDSWTSNKPTVCSSSLFSNYSFVMPDTDLILSANTQAQKHLITFSTEGDGEIFADGEYIEHGKETTITISPKDGWEVLKVYVNDEVVEVKDNKISVVVNSDTKIRAVFVEETDKIFGMRPSIVIMIGIIAVVVLFFIFVSAGIERKQRKRF